MFWKITTFAVVSAVAGIFGYWATDRNPPVIIDMAIAASPSVRPGGDLRVTYRVIRRASCETLLQRVIIDSAGTRLTLPDIEYKASPGPLGRDEYSVVVTIPTKATQGSARYRATTSYICNPLHRWWPITTLASDIKFMVDGAPIMNTGPVEVIPLR